MWFSVFLFSSRRRHTRFKCDWSSDVCSSDLGLVAITPACATVSPIGALLVGLAAGAGCALAVGLKFRFGFDDSLDVVGVHLVGGLIGTLLIGLLADATN